MRELFELVGLSSDDKQVSIHKDNNIYFNDDDVIVADIIDVIGKIDLGEWLELVQCEDAKRVGLNDFGITMVRGAKILYITTCRAVGFFDISDCLATDYGNVGVTSGKLCVLSKSDFNRLKEHYDDINDSSISVVPKLTGNVEADGIGNLIGDLEINTES